MLIAVAATSVGELAQVASGGPSGALPASAPRGRRRPRERRFDVDSTAPSGYKMELGYSDSSGMIAFTECASVNVNGCTIYATCAPSSGTDQATFTTDGNNLTGKIERNDRMRSRTITFNVVGKRR